MRQASTIDLSQLPPPALIEALDAESYVAAAIANYRARWPEFDTVLESEPVIKLIEVLAYRETLMRNRVNKAALATLLATAIGADLDHIAARFGVERLVVTPATATAAAVMEDDARLRRRTQLAPEAFSIAGPAGAYEYWALTVAPEIADAYAFSPTPGVVRVVVAMAAGEDVAQESVSNISTFLGREDVRPLTDTVSVIPADAVDYEVTATLVIKRGPDPSAVKDAAEASLAAYVHERDRIGADAYHSGIVSALAVGGVDNVVLTEPAADLAIGQQQLARLVSTSIAVVLS
jgi:phage-related baseplate assembly protein